LIALKKSMADTEVVLPMLIRFSFAVFWRVGLCPDRGCIPFSAEATNGQTKKGGWRAAFLFED
jgi:hypothetical protein